MTSQNIDLTSWGTLYKTEEEQGAFIRYTKEMQSQIK
jgi:hypothetical protein